MTLKAKFRTQFPASVLVQSPILLNKTGAVYTFSMDVTALQATFSNLFMTLGNVETVTGVKTFGAAGNVGKLAVAGTTSGSTVLNAAAIASGTLTLPAATDTLVGKATTDTLTNKTFDSAGTGNTLQVSSVTVSRGQFPGETTTGSATAGNVGEYMENAIQAGSAVSVTTATPKTIAQITLTAGDWDVSGLVNGLTATSTSVTGYGASLSLVTNTLDTNAGKFSQTLSGAFVPGNSATLGIAIPPVRFSVSGSTTVFLIADMTFTVSTMTAYGIIRARRVR